MSGSHEGKRLDSGYCGIAALSGRVAISGASCPRTTFAHEIGHNLSLGHPAADHGMFSLYPDGSIGEEAGWRFSDRQRVGGEHINNLMKSTQGSWRQTFITQQYYGAAKRHYIAANPIVSASRPPQVAVDFELAEGRSFVLVGDLARRGDWTVAYKSVVKRIAFPQDNSAQDHTLRLIHTNSGTELYRSALPIYEVGHDNPDRRSWSTRIPAYSGAGLSVEVLDRSGRVVMQHDLGGLEL